MRGSILGAIESDRRKRHTNAERAATETPPEEVLARNGCFAQPWVFQAASWFRYPSLLRNRRWRGGVASVACSASCAVHQGQKQAGGDKCHVNADQPCKLMIGDLVGVHERL